MPHIFDHDWQSVCTIWTSINNFVIVKSSVTPVYSGAIYWQFFVRHLSSSPWIVHISNLVSRDMSPLRKGKYGLFCSTLEFLSEVEHIEPKQFQELVKITLFSIKKKHSRLFKIKCNIKKIMFCVTVSFIFLWICFSTAWRISHRHPH